MANGDAYVTQAQCDSREKETRASVNVMSAKLASLETDIKWIRESIENETVKIGISESAKAQIEAAKIAATAAKKNAKLALIGLIVVTIINALIYLIPLLTKAPKQ